MKKEETISLSLALGFVVSITIALLLDYGGLRNAMVILSVILLLLSMGPFKVKGQNHNRMEKLVIRVFFSAFAGMIAFTCLYLGITEFHNDGWIPLTFFSVIGAAVGYFVYFCFQGKGWFNRRTNWMGVISPPSTREGKGEMKAFKIISLDKNTTCVYYPRLKRIHIIRRLYTDPMRHKDEFQERVNKLDGLIKQTGLMLDLKANAEVSPFFFDIEFVISKRLATEENIKLIKGLMDTMSADDHPLYLRVHIDNEIWFLHMFRNKMAKAKVYLFDDSDFESSQDSDEKVVAKHRPAEILDIILSGNNLDDIRELFEISQEEFQEVFSGE